MARPFATLLLLLGASSLATAQAPEPAAEPAAAAPAATPEPWHLDLTVRDVGIGLGNTAHVDGLRLNFRDQAPYTVHGVSATVWTPVKGRAGPGGTVSGMVLGVPYGGAGTVRGLGLGIGLGAGRDFDGIGVGVIGMGAGQRLRGIFLAGLGAGSGGDLDGLAVGGLGAGAGGDARGALLALLGAGVGGDLTGLAFGGLGAGTGGNLRGVAVAGLGAGAGGDVTGLMFGGLGAGAGGKLRGMAVGGLGVGAGRSIEGIAVAIGGVGAPRVRGLVAALAAGGVDVAGLVLAPAYFQVRPEGRFTGVSVSAVNRVLGEQRGLAIGVFNYAARLRGVQVGLLNWAGNNPPGLKLLPIVNAHVD